MDIQELESVQKVFTAKISGMKDLDLNYSQRLQKLSLMSLQQELNCIPQVCLGTFISSHGPKDVELHSLPLESHQQHGKIKELNEL